MVEECGEPLETKSGRCDRDAKFPDGKCKYHTAYDTEDWSPNYEHGIYMDRSPYYDKLPEREQKWIDQVVASFVSQAPWNPDNLANLQKLRSAVIDMHKKRRADAYIHQKGMAQTQTDGFHEEYGPIENEKENVLHITASRLSKDSLRTLRRLNCLPNEEEGSESDKEDALQQLAKLNEGND